MSRSQIAAIMLSAMIQSQIVGQTPGGTRDKALTATVRVLAFETREDSLDRQM